MNNYLATYGLKTDPFNITSDPNFFYQSSSHKEMLSTLFFGLRQKKGLMAVIGEVGTGKTTLCKVFLNQLPKEVATSVIFNSPQFSQVQLLKTILADFGLEPNRKNRFDLVKSLNSFLVDTSLSGGNALLVIDEAQNLTSKQLEQIRLLSNLETSREKLLQILLVGQPELEDKLNQFKLRQIKQRINIKCRLLPLREDEIKDYIEYRLNMAEGRDVGIEPDCYRFIYQFSKGIPRLINLLCERVLLLGFVQEKDKITLSMLKVCIEELQ
ncbi:MAG: AAA family ATPase [Candidatus Omnitrophica bacterium]|nr:AAA family ATPase [Candidatus Omnitrophota bacterium]MCF7892422.1 AAA family ATPase [Candidatus Omnitrophota bacterium]MCF7896085.1 AAA family ATPase [Candidatus Omnitrophota bacterium]MCF7897320.1 AAA family ATPase [Candidatus Omnitrophota bacterium]MCF7909961.1 AAA family ATPase [Candidatus Omnitrophota bacterium]